MDELPKLIEQAQKIYQQNFPLTTKFERAIFFSWGCTIGDCAFCYMSTQPKDKPLKESRRSIESILAEFILAKKLGWDIGFLTGGIGVLKEEELELILRVGSHIVGEKLWLSIGAVSKDTLKKYLPYIRGVVASTETIEPKLHKKVCPSKPLKPYEQMLNSAKELNLERAMTFIVGMGETHQDFSLLKEFIEKYHINKIHLYSLIPEKKTIFEKTPPPTAEEQAWWIGNLRINFPKLDIQCGIWEDRVERISLLLKAGANSISKFQALKLFNSPVAKEIEHQAELAGRKFEGTLTKLPKVDWKKEVERLDVPEEMKVKIFKKLNDYLESMD